jgi:hypothetical protein
MINEICDISGEESHELSKIENVGEEFFTWAEKYWALESTITFGLRNDDGESCSYAYLRQVFVKKINELCLAQALQSSPKL